MRVPARTLAAATVLVTALSVAGGGTVFADTERGHTGLVGYHYLQDTNTHDGANCFYQEGDGRTGPETVRVWPPGVLARDRTGGVDSQTVGWRAIVQQSTDGGATWHVTKRSKVYKNVATDSAKAGFSSHEYIVPENGKVRILVKMIWYVAGSTTIVEGTAVHQVDWYGKTWHIYYGHVHKACPRWPATL